MLASIVTIALVLGFVLVTLTWPPKQHGRHRKSEIRRAVRRADDAFDRRSGL